MVHPAPLKRNYPTPNKPSSRASGGAPTSAASAMDQKQGQAKSAVPIGRSNRINFAYGTASAGTMSSTHVRSASGAGASLETDAGDCARPLDPSSSLDSFLSGSTADDANERAPFEVVQRSSEGARRERVFPKDVDDDLDERSSSTLAHALADDEASELEDARAITSTRANERHARLDARMSISNEARCALEAPRRVPKRDVATSSDDADDGGCANSRNLIKYDFMRVKNSPFVVVLGLGRGERPRHAHARQHRVARVRDAFLSLFRRRPRTDDPHTHRFPVLQLELFRDDGER